MYDDSCNGTWLLKKDALEKYAWDDDGESEYLNSNFVKFLDEFVSLLDPSIEPFIKTVKIPYCVGGYGGDQIISGPNGNPCRVFPLGLYEIGLHKGYHSRIPADGSKLSYFDSGNGSSAKDKRIAEFNGDRIPWWTRSPEPSLPKRAWYIGSDGDYSETFTTVDYFYVRPAMIMQESILVDNKGNILPTTYPEPPTSITVPVDAVPTGSTISVSWTVVTGATYKLQRSVDNGRWADIYTGGNTSYNDTAGVWNKVKYRVSSVKSGITSGYTESKEVQIMLYAVKNITAPVQAMESQPIPIVWESTEQANTFVLERNLNGGGSWTQLYSGPNKSFNDTAGSWTSVQYRVKAGKDGVFGEYVTSAVIPVVPASALVINGTDGDLGKLTKDVRYTVTSNTGQPITLERRVNGLQIASLTVQSGFVYDIPVMELPTGTGTIKITAKVTPSGSGEVTVVRSWTYTKDAQTFPGDGGGGVVKNDDKTVLPLTIAECVRVPKNWGGSLDKALEKLQYSVDPLRIITGTYAGTGTFGQSTPNTIPVPFKPYLAFIGDTADNTIATVCMIRGRLSVVTRLSNPLRVITPTWSDTALSWYGATAEGQMNVTGRNYTYVIIGQ